MSKDEQEIASPQLVAAVRDYLNRATRHTTLKSTIQSARDSGHEIVSEYDTVRKFRTGERTALSSEEDYFSFNKFFTEDEYGRYLIRPKDNEQRDRHHQPQRVDTGKDAARPLMPRIGPAGSPKVTNLTSTMRVASMAIDGGQWGFGTVGLAVTIACPPWHGFAVQRGRVVMDPHPGRLSEQAERYWSEAREYTTEAYGRPGTAVVMLGYCTRLDPYWEVAGQDSPIGKFATGPEFAPLEGLSPGDRVTVTFGTWLGDVQDCDAVVEAASGDASFLTDGLASTTPAETSKLITDIEAKKRRLIALIRQTGLNSAPDGYTELVTCEIEIGAG